MLNTDEYDEGFHKGINKREKQYGRKRQKL
jgi:hypothetical protein